MTEVRDEDPWFYPKLLATLAGCLVFSRFLELWLPHEVARCLGYLIVPLCNYRLLGAQMRVSFARWSAGVALAVAALVTLKIGSYYFVEWWLSI